MKIQALLDLGLLGCSVPWLHLLGGVQSPCVALGCCWMLVCSLVCDVRDTDLTAPGQEAATFLWAGICHELIVDVGSHSQVTD